MYDEPEKSDGVRILVDRLWSRGLSKNNAQVDIWLKEIAPGNALRKWFAHDPMKWDGSRQRYFTEPGDKKALIDSIIKQGDEGVTLLIAAKDKDHNNAIVLMEYIGKSIQSNVMWGNYETH